MSTGTDAALLEWMDRMERKIDMLLSGGRRSEVDEHAFLAALADYCLRDGCLPTFTAAEVCKLKDPAIRAALADWIGGVRGVSALFSRCRGHRIGNIKLALVKKKSRRGGVWQFRPVYDVTK